MSAARASRSSPGTRRGGRGGRRWGPARERGTTLLIMAFLMAALLVLFAVLVDLIQVRAAQDSLLQSSQMAAVDAVRLDPTVSTLRDPHGMYRSQRRIALNASEVEDRVRAMLRINLVTIEPLMDGVTAEDVAGAAQVQVVNPRNGLCSYSPFGPTTWGHSACYYDAFVAVELKVPMKALWGAVRYTYRVVVVGLATDNDTNQGPPTAIPTSTRGPVPTFPVPSTPIPPCGNVCGLHPDK